MSALQRELFAKKRLPPIDEKLRDMPPISENENVTPSVSHSVHPSRKPIKDYSQLEWNTFFDEKLFINVDDDKFCVYTKGNTGPVFYLIHGGGYSGLTWACLTEELSAQVDCRIVAPDLRGHGETECEDEDDLSTERQVRDIVAIHKNLFKGESIPTIIVGHSMGGALAVNVAASEGIDSIIALGVIDVVEGTAMEALSSMARFLSSRPQHFSSVEAAIEWCVRSGTARNLRAAKVSMPSQIKKLGEIYTWRIDLSKTEPHWVGWFKGLSKMFLSCPLPKVLILAGPDRLDTDLMVGQMQGKFQTTILPKVGHSVQEDSPFKLADVLAKFVIRFQFCTPK